MNTMIRLAGVLAIMLGGLWLLQGLGVVHVRPILCFANCAPIRGRSTVWAVVGGVLVLAGGLVVFRAFARGLPRSK
jgi:hypothetical protein